MTRLTEVLERTRAENRAALVAYLPVGCPDVETSLRAMQVLAEHGADVVEVGLPYTDPLMDGPVIQTAATRALENGVRVTDVFRAVRTVADAGAAAVVMSYWNPVLRYGVDAFARDLAAAGGSGMITPDLVPDEGGDWIEASSTHGLDRVFLVAPSSTDQRLVSTTEQSSGFVYAVSVMGVTGARTQVGSAAEQLVTRVRKVTDLPICVGLGVSDGAQAHEVARFADGVIVGSALVDCLLDDDAEQGLRRLGVLTASLAEGVRR